MCIYICICSKSPCIKNIDGGSLDSNFLFRQELKRWNLCPLKQDAEYKILFMDVLGLFLYFKLKFRKPKLFWLKLKLRLLLLKPNIANTQISELKCNFSVPSIIFPNKISYLISVSDMQDYDMYFLPYTLLVTLF